MRRLLVALLLVTAMGAGCAAPAPGTPMAPPVAWNVGIGFLYVPTAVRTNTCGITHPLATIPFSAQQIGPFAAEHSVLDAQHVRLQAVTTTPEGCHGSTNLVVATGGSATFDLIVRCPSEGTPCEFRSTGRVQN